MKIEILSAAQCEQLRQLIAEAEHIIVCCHQNPDGDAIGSCLAWAEYLRMHDKDPMIAVPDKFPDFLQWMPGTERIVRYDKHTERVEEAFGTGGRGIRPGRPGVLSRLQPS